MNTTTTLLTHHGSDATMPGFVLPVMIMLLIGAFVFWFMTDSRDLEGVQEEEVLDFD